jgi:hypothetical protein
MSRVTEYKNWTKELGFDIKPGELDTPVITESAPEYTEAAFNATEVQDLAKNSLDFLAALALPTVFKYLFPDIFKNIWAWLLQHVHRIRDFSQLAIGLPRGFGKTMVIKLFVLYCILFTRKQFILIICGTQTKANNIINDIMGMLNEQNVKRTFGDWNLGAETNRQDLKKFGFRGRNIVLMGAGASSDIRGITLENERPDVMIFDDIQTREDADSEVISSNLETWMVGTAMKAKSPKGCLYVFIANMYPTKHSLLRKLKVNPTWTKFIVGGILSDGSSLWEDLQPINQLLREFENDLSMGKPEVFYAEVLNDENASVNNYIDISKIPDCPYEGELQHQGNFIIIDPSNDKGNSDFVSIGYFEIFEAVPVSKKILEGRFSPGETIINALRLALEKNCRVICVESNAYQYSMLYWFNYIINQYGFQDAGFHCLEIYSGSRSKNTRILEMFKSLLKGELYYTYDTKAQVNSQIVSFNPLKTTNTDGILDLLTYAPKVIELYGDFILSTLTLESQEFDGIPLRSALETSSF